MSQVKRLYVEKKSSYAVKAKELAEELKAYLSIEDVSDVRELIRYDVQNVSAETMKKAAVTVFSEPPVDDLYEEDFPKKDGDKVFSVEFLPGQFDQRADSAVQCLQLLDEKEEPIIRSATTYVFSGNISDEELEKIKEYCINPVDSREADEKKPETLVMDYEDPADVAIFDGFKDKFCSLAIFIDTASKSLKNEQQHNSLPHIPFPPILFTSSLTPICRNSILVL